MTFEKITSNLVNFYERKISIKNLLSIETNNRSQLAIRKLFKFRAFQILFAPAKKFYATYNLNRPGRGGGTY